MELAGSRCAVIGGAGFIGSHTVDRLLQEDVAEIRVFDNFSRGTQENLVAAVRDPRVKVIHGDICHPDMLNAMLRGSDTVFHFAAMWLLECDEFMSAAFDVNVRGTFNVLEACVLNRVKKLVYSSSASVYGDAEEEPMSEHHPYNNRNFYGATKISGEAIARAFHTRHGLPWVGLRYMNVYGPRQRDDGVYSGVVSRMLSAIEGGKGPEVQGDGLQAFDFVHVEDCAEANVCAVKSEAADACFNVGTGIKTPIGELANKLLRLTGSPFDVRRREARQAGAIRNRVGDTTRAEADLRFRARITLDDGLRGTIAWRRLRQSSGNCQAASVGMVRTSGGPK